MYRLANKCTGRSLLPDLLPEPVLSALDASAASSAAARYQPLLRRHSATVEEVFLAALRAAPFDAYCVMTKMHSGRLPVHQTLAAGLQGHHLTIHAPRRSLPWLFFRAAAGKEELIASGEVQWMLTATLAQHHDTSASSIGVQRLTTPSSRSHLCPASSQLRARVSAICPRPLLRGLRPPLRGHRCSALPGGGIPRRLLLCFLLPPLARCRQPLCIQLLLRGDCFTGSGVCLCLRLPQLPPQLHGVSSESPAILQCSMATPMSENPSAETAVHASARHGPQENSA